MTAPSLNPALPGGIRASGPSVTPTLSNPSAPSAVANAVTPAQAARAAVPAAGFDTLREGQAVTFDRGQGPKGPRAENVKLP